MSHGDESVDRARAADSRGKVDALAARLERPRGWIVKQALAAFIDQEEERRRLTLEALADVDAGLVIDHQAVQAWADKPRQ